MLRDGGYYVRTAYTDSAEPGLIEDDAEFIAHAREDVPALLAEVEQLRTALDAVRALTDEARRTGRRLSALEVADALDGAP